MKLFIGLLLFYGQIMGVGNRKVFKPAVSPPTMTFRMQADSASNTCGTTGASPCTTNGQAFYSFADLVGTNNATQTTSGNQPTFTTNAINTNLPAITFSGSSQFLALTTPVAGATDPNVYYVVLKFTTPGGGGNPVFGGSQCCSWLYRVNSAQQMNFVYQDVSDQGNSSTAFSTNTWYGMVLVFYGAAGTASFSHCSAGTLVADASITYGGVSAPNPVRFIGADTADGIYLGGSIAEFGYLSGTSTAGICPWLQSHWGI